MKPKSHISLSTSPVLLAEKSRERGKLVVVLRSLSLTDVRGLAFSLVLSQAGTVNDQIDGKHGF